MRRQDDFITVAPETSDYLHASEKLLDSTKTSKSRSSTNVLDVGGIYTWNQLKEHFDWEEDKRGYYLRERKGRIVCACLRADLNPSAPWEILVGQEESQIRQAEVLARESMPIPVFIKEAVDQWEYWGEFQFERCEKDQDKIRPMLPQHRIDNTSMVIYLSTAD